MSTEPIEPPRRYQFRLLTLIILTTLFAVWMAWWSIKSRHPPEVDVGLDLSGTIELPAVDEPSPLVEPSPLAKRSELVVEVLVDGRCEVAGKQMTSSDFCALLREKTAASPELRVVIRGQKHVLFKHIYAVREICKKEGVTDIQLTAIDE